MPSDDERFKALTEHYKDTFTHVQGYLKQRDWYFAATLIVLVLMLFQLAAPASSERVISAVIGKQIGTETQVDTTFTGTVIWLLMLAAVFRYFQLVVLINRQYMYVHALEERLAAEYGGTVFTREGKWYLDRYPGFSNWAHFIYRGVFPTVIVLVATAKIYTDIVPAWPGWGACCVSLYLALNLAIYLTLLVSVALYIEIVRLGRTARLALVTVWALIAQRRVDDAVRAEAKAIDASGATTIGSAPPEPGADQG